MSPFSKIVKKSLKKVGDWGRFGEHQVFIFALWQTVKNLPEFDNDEWDLKRFKEALVVAQRNGELRLARADLVSVMHPLLVSRSETSFLEGRYHFVMDD